MHVVYSVVLGLLPEVFDNDHSANQAVPDLGQLTGADPGFVVRGGVSRRGVWGPLKVPSGSKAEPK